MRRVHLVLALVFAAACTSTPPAADAGSDAAPDAFTPSDANVDAFSPCSPACGAGQLCCPVALAYGCVAPTSAGVCPMPDLTVDGDRASSSARVVWQYFPTTDCAVVEGCISAPGWRRLLRFDTYTPNVGTGDFAIGDPAAHPELFEYSSCHMHNHFNGYANYTLLDSTGATAATGHKQAFCLEDYEALTSTAGPTYDCNNQGISVGWGDTYGNYLDCQWIDVTDVAPGNYTIRIDILGGTTGTMHLVEEISYANNTADAAVTIPVDDPAVDPTAACSPAIDGVRDCGWVNAGTFTCTPGSMVAVGCGGSCGVGSCHGDALLRICPDTTPCGSHTALGQGDSECGGAGANDCPGSRFTCPTSGQYTVLTGAYDYGDTSETCVPAAGAAL
jgi:hypothetical protein